MPALGPEVWFDEINDLQAARDETRVKLGERHWWQFSHTRDRAGVSEEFPPRHTKIILLKTRQWLFSILHCCNLIMLEWAKMVYWKC